MADSMSANDNIDWDSLDWGPFHWESTNWAEHRQPPTDPVMNPPARAPKAGSSSDSKKAATEADKDKDVGSGSRVDDLAEFVSFWDGCRARYLDEAPPHKAELDVRLGTPDIETGKPGDGGSRQFISPLSPAKVESLLKQAGTFDVPDSYDDINVGCYSGPERNKSPFNPDYHPQIEGWERGEFVRDVLTHGINGGILPRFSNWRLTSHNSPSLIRYNNNDVEWSYQYACRYVTESSPRIFLGESDPDDKKPHADCWMTGNACPYSNRFTIAELMAALNLALGRALLPLYKQHNLFPVTVVYASFTYIRVSQCVLNVKDKSWTVHMTEPINFRGPYRRPENWTRFLQVLGYMVGEPIGNTA